MKHSLYELVHINYPKLLYSRYKNNPLVRMFCKACSRRSLVSLARKSGLIPIVCKDTNYVGQLTHPDAVYASDKFNNKVVLTVSGYPFGDEHDESQYVILSDDGIHFSNIRKDYAVAEYTGGGRSHYSDGVIIENDDKIYVFTRYCDVDQKNCVITIYRKETTDLINWTNETPVLKKAAQTYISPAILKSGNGFVMYYVEEQADKRMVLKRIISKGLKFEASVEEDLEILDSPEGMNLWHIDVVEEGNILHGLFVYTLGGGGKGARLFYARSEDNGKSWRVYKEIKLDVDYRRVSKVYRSTMLKVNGKWNLYVPINTVDECWFLFVKPNFNYEEYI
ncbi:MAG: hypothetical protein IJT81_08750 [Lachnospiraceae bacterium]|nr:hypothetical protein [Lachnospiraceae bacterium]